MQIAPFYSGSRGRRSDGPLNLGFLAVHMADKNPNSVRSGGFRDGTLARGVWVGLLVGMTAACGFRLRLEF